MAVNGEFNLVFGTSASSPVSASILSAINDARLAIGKKPIGFINPTVSIVLVDLMSVLRSHFMNDRYIRACSKARSMILRMERTQDAVLRASVRLEAGIPSLGWVHPTSLSSWLGGSSSRDQISKKLNLGGTL